MLTSAIADNSNFELCRVDIDRPGPYYSLDTVKLLRQEYPLAQLIYLMGGDSLHDLPDWHNPTEFVATCDQLAVMRRPEDRLDLTALEEVIQGLAAKVHFVNAPLLDISASKIRQRIALGHPFRYYVPLSTFQIIQDRGLYR